MKTDLPLKVLARVCGVDLLPLLGSAATAVVGVESVEMPMTATALDTLLRLRDATGRVYGHLVEWQGYPDPLFLWRVLLYLGWLGLNRTESPLAVTVVYLKPGDDVGGTLDQQIAGEGGWAVTFHVVRLWEQDAVMAVRGGRPGLAVLSPLMGGATAVLVEAAAQVVLEHDELAQQADLLTILGVFAAPLVAPERFVRLIGRERLMASELISYLFQDELAEVKAELVLAQERERVAQERERVAQERERVALAQIVADAIRMRFPNTPSTLITNLSAVEAAERLQTLHGAVLRAPDQESVERLLRDTLLSPPATN